MSLPTHPSRTCRRPRRIVAPLLTAVAALAILAINAAAFTPPPGTPALDQMVLAPMDIGSSAKVESQGYLTNLGSMIGYRRTFGPSVAANGEPLLAVVSTALLANSAAQAELFSSELEIGFRSMRADRNLASSFLGPSGSRHRLTVRIGQLHALAGVAGGLLVPLHVHDSGISIPLDFVAMRVDRVVDMLGVVGVPGTALSASAVAGLADTQASHTQLQLLPMDTVEPGISGVWTPGQAITATTGTWSNAPASYSYQWQLCNTSGTGCSPIAGATLQSYTLTAADAGATLEVTVTAINPDGQSAPVTSAPTGVVS